MKTSVTFKEDRTKKHAFIIFMVKTYIQFVRSFSHLTEIVRRSDKYKNHFKLMFIIISIHELIILDA